MKVIHFARQPEEKARKRGKSPAMFYRDNSLSQWIALTWQEVFDRVESTACKLAAMGIGEGDRVAICSQNKPHILIVDMANHANRAVSVPMYPTLSAAQIEYIINDAQISLIFVGEQQQYDNVVEILPHSPYLKKIVVFDNSVSLGDVPCAVYFSDFLAEGRTHTEMASLVHARRKAANEEDLAIILYTSGTSGEPKGVMLSHGNLLATMHIHNLRIKLTKGDKSMVFLPLSHIFEYGWTNLCMQNDVKLYFNQYPSEIQQTLREVRPHNLCAVPRFWEKVAAGVDERIAAFSPFKQGLVAWAVAVGKAYNIDTIRCGKKPGFNLWLRYYIANRLIFSKLKKTVGIENAKVLPTAGAALSDKLAIFFRSLGIPIYYGYGLTETTATVACYTDFNYTIGSVGDVMPDVEVRIGDDNEIQIKGKTVAKGYYNKPEATAAAFVDGWFRSGDAGRLDGQALYMTDRIKDLFKTSNGKYISPQQIETLIGADRYIEQIAVIGDNRNYVTAIIVPEMTLLRTFAEEQNISCDRIEELLIHPQVVRFYADRIAGLENGLASFERIKKFRLVKHSFSIASGELTSTLKLRRAVIQQNYAWLIDEMYDSPASVNELV
ncbi:MAG: long-chain fatty acid--CoA ligase [Prevotellaceae bacterium]|jgi:long-chain acyl-CoA synthetase|nr:long-chain fatty acid--CoA ligase [Prevotellaceae bacterium]